MIEKIEKVIRDNIEIDDLKISPATSFKDDLGLDSFEMSQLLCSLEDEIGTTIDDTKLTDIITVADLIDCIEKGGSTALG